MDMVGTVWVQPYTSLHRNCNPAHNCVAKSMTSSHIMETNYDRLEQYSRRSNLRFHGIDETDNDDTTAKVMAIANDVMKVTPPIGIGDIVTSHRLGKPSAGGRPRPVIVRFTDIRPRDVILRA